MRIPTQLEQRAAQLERDRAEAVRLGIVRVCPDCGLARVDAEIATCGGICDCDYDSGPYGSGAGR